MPWRRNLQQKPRVCSKTFILFQSQYPNSQVLKPAILADIARHCPLICRYRKVPADLCEESKADHAKYDPVSATCPTLAPAGLQLYVQTPNLVAVGETVTFYLDQDAVRTSSKRK